MLYFEPETEEDEKKKLQKLLNYAKKENWVGQINDILELAEKKDIQLKY